MRVFKWRKMGVTDPGIPYTDGPKPFERSDPHIHMNIEYVHSGSPMSPVIRFCEFMPEEAEELRKLFESLAVGETTEIALHELSMFNALGNLRLTLRASQEDLGIQRVPGQLRGFELLLTPETFADLAELTLPFEQAEQSVAFQWLDERGEINLLLSPSGWW